jgi:Zn-dependent protease with chaperone function
MNVMEAMEIERVRESTTEITVTTLRRPLPELDCQEYEHPFDRRALDALEGTPGLEFLIRKVNEHGIERMLRIQYTGSNLKVTPRNIPELHFLLEEVCGTLHLSPLPDFYIAPGDEINAFTAGVERPIIVLNAGCVDRLTRDELCFVIAHEVGHVKSNHCLYYQLGRVLPIVGRLVSTATFGIGGLVSAGLEVALSHWSRMSEFTADRAGLLGCQSSTAAITAMLKCAGLPHKYSNQVSAESFIEQARQFEEYNFDKLDRLAKILSSTGKDHPWTVMRAAEFLRWIDSGVYQRVLDRETAAPRPLSQAAGPRFCPHCGSRVAQSGAFCAACGGRMA